VANAVMLLIDSYTDFRLMNLLYSYNKMP